MVIKHTLIFERSVVQPLIEIIYIMANTHESAANTATANKLINR